MPDQAPPEATGQTEGQNGAVKLPDHTKDYTERLGIVQGEVETTKSQIEQFRRLATEVRRTKQKGGEAEAGIEKITQIHRDRHAELMAQIAELRKLNAELSEMMAQLLAELTQAPPS